MKIFVSCDMEGTAGVSSWQQVDARAYTPEYAIFQKYMTGEVCAAIEGARSAGATEVLINDSHGPMRNLLLDELPHDVRVLFGNRKPLSMAQNLSREFAGAFFTGYHGSAGDLNATLSHTFTPSVVYEVRINGIACSEALLNAGVAGYFGVPVLLVTGDRTTVEGARSHMPWITGVVVKESIGNFAVDSLSPAAAREAIRAGAAQAMAAAPLAKPYAFASPVTMEIDLVGVQQADVIEVIPGFTRTGGRQVRLVHDDYLTVYRAFVAAFRTGAVAV